MLPDQRAVPAVMQVIGFVYNGCVVLRFRAAPHGSWGRRMVPQRKASSVHEPLNQVSSRI